MKINANSLAFIKRPVLEKDVATFISFSLNKEEKFLQLIEKIKFEVASFEDKYFPLNYRELLYALKETKPAHKINIYTSQKPNTQEELNKLIVERDFLSIVQSQPMLIKHYETELKQGGLSFSLSLETYASIFACDKSTFSKAAKAHIAQSPDLNTFQKNTHDPDIIF